MTYLLINILLKRVSNCQFFVWYSDLCFFVLQPPFGVYILLYFGYVLRLVFWNQTLLFQPTSKHLRCCNVDPQKISAVESANQTHRHLCVELCRIHPLPGFEDWSVLRMENGINQLMVEAVGLGPGGLDSWNPPKWTGLATLGVPLVHLESQTTNPNQQLTISWIKFRVPLRWSKNQSKPSPTRLSPTRDRAIQIGCDIGRRCFAKSPDPFVFCQMCEEQIL